MFRDRSAASSFVVRSSLRAKARNHIPRLLVSSVSLPLNVSSISVIIWLSSVVVRKLPRMLRYVANLACSCTCFEGYMY